MKACAEVGLKSTRVMLPDTVSQADLLAALNKLNEDSDVHGIIVQMPLPSHINSQLVVSKVDYRKDVDGFHEHNVAELAKRSGKPLFLPCTAAGVIKLLDSIGFTLEGKTACVLGRSDIVGMPMFQLLQKAGATVTLCHTKTRDLAKITSQADLLVVAAGVPLYIGKEHVKPGAVVIDVGIHKPDGSKKLVGDVKFDEVKEVASAITPVPGGVGPMTVALLLQNTIAAAQRALERAPMEYIPLNLVEPVPADEVVARIQPKPIAQVAEECGILPSELDLHGPYKAKVHLSILERLKGRPRGKMVVVTGVNPTQFGEGKTTTLLGLVQALNVQLGKLTFGTIRQPSQGPTFGIKGGAAGGGYSQVVPMSDVNLHLTGDIHAVSAAHNLMCAAVDARILHEGQAKTISGLFKRMVGAEGDKEGSFTPAQLTYLRKLGITKTEPKDLTAEEQERFCRLNMDPKAVLVRRVVDCNDRFLRDITIGLGSAEKGFERQSGYDIAVASEVMAILALSKDLADFRARVGRIIVARNKQGEPVTTEDVGVAGAMAVLMTDAVMPTLLQTLEGTPMLMHAGPFANIAHGQSSIIADEMALRLAGPDGFCVTESGFGADMGFEKYAAIKSRAAGVQPDCAVLVVTVRAMIMHGEYEAGEAASTMSKVQLLEKGCVNMRRHIRNIVQNFGTPVVVAINPWKDHKQEEEEVIARIAKEEGAADCVVTYGWAKGSGGAAKLAQAVVDAVKDKPTPPLKQLYNLEDALEDKIRAVATKIYGASDISLSDLAKEKIAWITKHGLHHMPLCMAKTPLSFSHDPALKGAPTGFVFPVVDIRVSAGAGFIYPLAGDIMTMPGLGSRPGYLSIDIDTESGAIKGLF